MPRAGGRLRGGTSPTRHGAARWASIECLRRTGLRSAEGAEAGATHPAIARPCRAPGSRATQRASPGAVRGAGSAVTLRALLHHAMASRPSPQHWVPPPASALHAARARASSGHAWVQTTGAPIGPARVRHALVSASSARYRAWASGHALLTGETSTWTTFHHESAWRAAPKTLTNHRAHPLTRREGFVSARHPVISIRPSAHTFGAALACRLLARGAPVTGISIRTPRRTPGTVRPGPPPEAHRTASHHATATPAKAARLIAIMTSTRTHPSAAHHARRPVTAPAFTRVLGRL